METYHCEPLQFIREEKRLVGELYLPEKIEKPALVILSHGFGSNFLKTKPYAKYLVEHGIAAYIFDFIGGGLESKSDGDTTQMSVLTEAADLTTVLMEFKKDSRFKQIFLLGASQGGFVSTYVAAHHPEDVAGLVLLYPAFVLQEDAKKRTPDLSQLPNVMDVMGVPIGKIYTLDALSFDIYEEMKKYLGPTLIVHGTADPIVPLSYSQRAVKTLNDATLKTIAQAGHGFVGEELQEAEKLVLRFIDPLIKAAHETLHLAINDNEVTVEWEDGETIATLKDFVAKQPLTIQTSKYGGFEQVGSIGKELPSQDVQMTTHPGDIVLYDGSEIVLFYGSNSWSYTKLGVITEPSGVKLTQLLDRKEATVTLFLR